jgi:hypothetical protein
MSSLQDLVDVDVVEDVEIEEIPEEDPNDPIPSTSTASPTTSKAPVSKWSKRTLFGKNSLCICWTFGFEILAGARAKTTIWASFIVDDMEMSKPSRVGSRVTHCWSRLYICSFVFRHHQYH